MDIEGYRRLGEEYTRDLAAYEATGAELSKRRLALIELGRAKGFPRSVIGPAVGLTERGLSSLTSKLLASGHTPSPKDYSKAMRGRGIATLDPIEPPQPKVMPDRHYRPQWDASP